MSHDKSETAARRVQAGAGQEVHASGLPLKKNVNLTIDGIPVSVPEGTTVLEAARKVNVKIPTLCDHPDLCRRALCRLCVVEADGRGKLIAACANEVWEGVKIVTNNARILAIRKTIIELILANHPQECLSCVRNTKCELQSLAERFGIRAMPFRRGAAAGSRKEIAAGTLVRDMGKCVKCGRCVEACQEIQTIRAINTSHRSVGYEISTPYGQALSDSLCVFCGHCASVCPVGAIYAHDQSVEIRAALNGGQRVAAELEHSAVKSLTGELGLPPEALTAGKLITALKRIGFDKVYDAAFSADASAEEEARELSERIKNKGKLPMISGCSQGVYKFIKEFYPAFSENLFAGKSSGQIFEARAGKNYAGSAGPETSKITTVSIMPCVAGKFEAGAFSANGFQNPDFVITAAELARMIRVAGIDPASLPESPFDTFPAETRGARAENAKIITVNGFASARRVMDALGKGECEAALIRIMSCPEGCVINGA